MKAREVKRAKLAQRYAHKREEIAAKVKAGEMDHEEAYSLQPRSICERRSFEGMLRLSSS